MPARSASAGSASFAAVPRTRTSLRCARVAPITASAVSVRPEPTSPAKPRISPACSVKRFTGPPRSICSSLTSSTRGASAARAGFGGKLLSIRRPTIIRTSCSTSVRATSVVATYWPSRSTVMRSHTAKISSR